MKKPITVVAVLVALILVLSVSLLAVYLSGNKPNPSPTQRYTYAVVNTYPHDSAAFTEGLVFYGGFLYESTGLEGSSTLRKVDLASGTILQKVSLPPQYFGEGIAIVGERIIQLTYQTHVGFVYNKTSFALVANFSYPTEGWGLTYDGARLIMSDGSDNLYFLDPQTLQRTGQIQVHDGNNSVPLLNELEYVNGDIYANVFTEQKIAIINPETGVVKAWVDMSGLQDANGDGWNKVLNGIAFDSSSNRLFVTGKDWPHLYEIELVPAK